MEPPETNTSSNFTYQTYSHIFNFLQLPKIYIQYLHNLYGSSMDEIRHAILKQSVKVH